MAHYIVLYGGKVEKDGQLNIDSTDRCEVAVREAWRHADDSFVIFSVDDTIPDLRATTAFYLCPRLPREDCFIENPKASNSLGEAKAAMELLRQRNVRDVTLVTSWYHMPRVYLQWRLLGWRWFSHRITCRVSWKMQYGMESIRWEAKGFLKLFKALR
ncbi:MAG TPA: YdcF family protein [Candidatus Paceibacterota bacterium]|nr:YdcF family protein [Candidatus Paceibacterota bacterium]